MTINKILLSALQVIALGLWLISQKSGQIMLEQPQSLIFSCPNGTKATYQNSYKQQFYDENLTTALIALSMCKNISAVTELVFDLPTGHVTNINIFKTVLEKTPSLQIFYLNVNSNPITEAGIADVKSFLEILPDLSNLTLGLFGTDLVSASGLKNAFYNNIELRVLTFQFGGSHLQNLDGLVDSLSGLINLREFFLTVLYSNLKGFPNINNQWQNLKKLNTFFVDFEINSKLSDLTYLGQTLNKIQSLQNLQLYFLESVITDTQSLWQGTKSLRQLQLVEISFDNNQIGNLQGIENAFLNLGSVNEFELTISNNQLQEVILLWQLIKRLQIQSRLSLHLQSNKILNLKGMEDAFQSCNNLDHLELDLRVNAIVDVLPLGQSLQNLYNIQSFELNLAYNRVNNSIIGLAEDIQFQIADNYAFCPFFVDIRSNPFVSDPETRKHLKDIEQKMIPLVQYADCQTPLFTFYY